MTLESFLRRVTSILEDSGLPYMLTGSLATAYYAEPRSTRDVDFVVEVTLEEIEGFVTALEAEGYYASLDAAREAVAESGQFNAVDPGSGWKVDFIVRKDRPFSRAEFSRRLRVELLGRELPVVTPEDLIVAKLEWARKGSSERQLGDVRSILLQRGPELDRDYIERWVDELGLARQWRAVRDDS